MNKRFSERKALKFTRRNLRFAHSIPVEGYFGWVDDTRRDPRQLPKLIAADERGLRRKTGTIGALFELRVEEGLKIQQLR
jgi:hypothetical protein